MRLYVRHKDRKIYLRDTDAPTRNELAHKIGKRFYLKFDSERHEFSASEVQAYMEDTTLVGIISGSFIGLLAGPISLVIGGLLGMLFAVAQDEKANREARIFNASEVYQ